MVARGAIHNPKIFHEYKTEFENIELEKNQVFENIKNFKDEDYIDNIIHEDFIKDNNNENRNKEKFNSSFSKDNNNKENNNNEIILELNENNDDKINDKKLEENKDIKENNNNNNNKKNNKKNKKNEEEDDGENMQCSQNLARVLDIKYNGRNFDLWDILKEYTKLVKKIKNYKTFNFLFFN